MYSLIAPPHATPRPTAPRPALPLRHPTLHLAPLHPAPHFPSATPPLFLLRASGISGQGRASDRARNIELRGRWWVSALTVRVSAFTWNKKRLQLYCKRGKIWMWKTREGRSKEQDWNRNIKNKRTGPEQTGLKGRKNIRNREITVGWIFVHSIFTCK